MATPLALWLIARALFWSPRPEPVKAALRNLLNEIVLADATAAEAAKFAELRGRRGLKLHLGCGGDLKDNWVNLDLNLNGTVPALPAVCSPETRFILHDLRSGALPLDDASCAFIYSSHFFEHLEYDAGVRLMAECRRVLQHGGIFRAAMPDFPGMFRAYLAGNEEHFNGYSIFDVFPDRPHETVNLVDHVNYGVYQFGEHKCIYDQDKLCRVLRHLGFSIVAVTDYREGIDSPTELRRRYTFYVEAVK